MSVKELKTRVKLKYDLKTNWDSVGSTFYPLLGEVCVVKVSDNEFLFKVGDGKRNFASLPYTQAIASDVYAWAKKSGIEISETSSGSSAATAVTGISWDTTANKLSITKGSISTANDNQTITGNGVSFDKNAAVNIVGSGSVTVTGNASNNKITIGGPDTLKNPNSLSISGKQGTAETFNVSYDGSLSRSISIAAEKPTLSFGGTSTLFTVSDGNASIASQVTLPSINKDTVGLGKVENKALDTAVSNSANYITSAAVKSYVDSAIAGVSQFKYEIVSSLPEASASTVGTIYLIKHAHTTGDGYDEYITIQSGTAGAYTYSWEKIGNTDMDLSAYLNSVQDKGSGDYVEYISKSNQMVAQTRKSFASFTIAGSTYKPNDLSNTTVAVSANNPTLSWGKSATIGTIGNTTFSVTMPANPDSHYATHLYVGASGAASSAATGNGNTYIKLYDNSTARESYKISGSGAVTVGSDANGNLTINAPVVTDTNTWRDVKVDGHDALGNTITTGPLNLISGTNIKVSYSSTGVTFTGKSDSDIKTLAEAQIKTHSGVDKVGTVTGGDGTYLTGSTTIGINSAKFCLTEDELILDGGSATTNTF